MPGEFLVPTDATVREKLKFLYGNDLEVHGADAPDASEAICALYVRPDGNPGAVALCDIDFGAYAGASLSMLPVDVAKEAAATGDLPKVVMDNLHEIMNICVNLLMGDETPHLKLETVFRTVAELPEPALGLVQGADGPSFKVDIPRYGSGVLRMLS
jgi:hypothetical protein